MEPKKLHGLDGIVERCPGCWTALKAGAWLKDNENGKPRILMTLTYCNKCKKHLRTTYLFYEQYSFSMDPSGRAKDESTCYEADPLQVPPERPVAVKSAPKVERKIVKREASNRHEAVIATGDPTDRFSERMW